MNGRIKCGDLIQVIWQDTCVEHTYMSLEGALGQTFGTMSTVGNFINQDDEAIRIAFVRCLDKDKDIVDCVATIPLSCIQQINILKAIKESDALSNTVSSG